MSYFNRNQDKKFSTYRGWSSSLFCKCYNEIKIKKIIFMYIDWSVKFKEIQLCKGKEYNPYMIIDKYEQNLEYIIDLIKSNNRREIPKVIVYNTCNDEFSIMLFIYLQDTIYLFDGINVYHLKRITFKDYNVFKYINYALQNLDNNINEQNIVFIRRLESTFGLYELHNLKEHLSYLNDKLKKLIQKNELKPLLNIRMEFYCENNIVKPIYTKNISNIIQIFVDYNNNLDKYFSNYKKIDNEIIEYLNYVRINRNKTKHKIKFKSLLFIKNLDYSDNTLLEHTITFSDINIFQIFLQRYYIYSSLNKV